MSFLRRVAAQIAEARGANPQLPWGDSVPPPPSMIASSASGIPVTQDVVTGVTAVYGCCGLIADSVSSLPLELRDGPERKTSSEVPLSPLLKRPYAEISRRDWWIQFIWSLALRGNFYAHIIQRDARGYPLQIKPVHNDQVNLWRDKKTGALRYRFYGVEVPLADVFHVRYQSTAGSVIGLNPIQVLALTFGNAIAKERFVESFYLNSANPMGIIEVPGYLDRTETRKMMRTWNSAHQGLNKANLPAILTEGATFRPITIAPHDAQLLDALNFSDAQICGRIFRVPPHMVGITDRATSWGRGIEQQERSFFANTLVGFLGIGMEALSDCHPPDRFVHFDVTKRERGATLERAQAGALGMNSGVFVADEVRDWFDLPPLANGDGQKSFMPVNTQLLEMAELTLKQAKLMPPPTAAPGNAAPPRNTAIKPTPTNPPRRPAPSATASNGRSMSVEDAWMIVESAVSQATRMRYAADMANGLTGPDED